MYVIKEKTWIEDYYEINELYEDVIYTDESKAIERIKDISKKDFNLFLECFEGNPTTIIRGSYYKYENEPKNLMLEGVYFLYPVKLEVK